MEEKIKLDKDYLEHINEGYNLSKELGLSPDILEGLSAGNNRIKAMKEGMELHRKERALEKNKSQEKDVIPSFDIDSINDREMHFDNLSQDKDIGMDIEK